MIVEVSGASAESDGTWILFENMRAQQHLTIDGQQYGFSLRALQYPLVFSIELKDFKKEVHPGTPMARAYSSAVTLLDGELRLPQLISMNEPLRYKGYTFFQSSFRQDDKTETTVLAVVKNYGRTFPYISSIVICIGLLLHIFIMLPRLIAKVRTPAVLMILGLVLGSTSVQAQTPDLGYVEPATATKIENQFGSQLSPLVIQHQGRLKPLDTYARTLLKTLSEKSTFEGAPAIEWFTQLLIDPLAGLDKKVFTVRSPEVIKALQVSPDSKYRYSYRQLSGGIQMIFPMLQKNQPCLEH